MPVFRKRSLLPSNQMRADAARMAAQQQDLGPAPVPSSARGMQPQGPRPGMVAGAAPQQGAPQGARQFGAGSTLTANQPVDRSAYTVASPSFGAPGGQQFDQDGNPIGGGPVDVAAQQDAMAANADRIRQAERGNPPQAVPGPSTSYDNQPSNDEALQRAIAELLGQGPADTAEQEAYIQQMMQDNIGQGQRALMGRLGAAGFGTSGAAGAMAGDLSARAAREAAGQVFDLRDQAQRQWLDQLRTGIGAQQGQTGLEQSQQRIGLDEQRIEAEKQKAEADTAMLQAWLDSLGGGAPQPALNTGVSVAPPDGNTVPTDGSASDGTPIFNSASELPAGAGWQQTGQYTTVDGVQYRIYQDASGHLAYIPVEG